MSNNFSINFNEFNELKQLIESIDHSKLILILKERYDDIKFFNYNEPADALSGSQVCSILILMDNIGEEKMTNEIKNTKNKMITWSDTENEKPQIKIKQLNEKNKELLTNRKNIYIKWNKFFKMMGFSNYSKLHKDDIEFIKKYNQCYYEEIDAVNEFHKKLKLLVSCKDDFIEKEQIIKASQKSLSQWEALLYQQEKNANQLKAIFNETKKNVNCHSTIQLIDGAIKFLDENNKLETKKSQLNLKMSSDDNKDIWIKYRELNKEYNEHNAIKTSLMDDIFNNLFFLYFIGDDNPNKPKLFNYLTNNLKILNKTLNTQEQKIKKFNEQIKTITSSKNGYERN